MTPPKKGEDMIVVVDARPLRTTIRQAVSPYLPPPLVQAMHDTIDPALKPFVGEEATITIVGSLLLAFLIYHFLKVATATFSNKKAVARDDNDEDVLLEKVLSKQAYQDTVVFAGPMLAGKTRLLYWLCHDQPNVQTVVSMRPNVAFKTVSVGTTQDQKTTTTRVMDYPGHLSIQSSQLLDVLDKRICLVLDSTQPVGPAADILFQLLSLPPPSSGSDNKRQILIACHKSDIKGSKNHKRIKIQLRNELEHILSIQTTCSWWQPGKPIVWEELDSADIAFLSTSCEDDHMGMKELNNFVCEGTLPEDAVNRK